MGKRYRWPPAGDSRPGNRPGWDMGGTAPSVSVLVLAGGRAAARHDSAAFEDASMALLEWADALGREAVGAACCEVVATVLAELWEQGWQPGELIRACRRGRSARHISLLVSALAAPRTWACAGGAAPIPVWSAQLEDLGVAPRWREHQDWLAPWATGAKLGWPEALMMALETLGVLTGLPPLQPLVAPPSAWCEWRPGIAVDSDDPVLVKVRALLAKAESTDFDAEAEALTAKAQQLMARHAIDEAIARDGAGGLRTEKPVARRFAIDDPYASAKSLLLSAVASANGGRSVWYADLALMTVIAFDADLEAIDTLYTSLLVQGSRSMLAGGRLVGGRGRSQTRSFRRSFLLAFAGRIRERLELAAVAARRDAEEELATSVLPVLAGRQADVDDAVAAMFPKLIRRRGPRITSEEGWLAGRSAAEMASLGPDAAITPAASA